MIKKIAITAILLGLFLAASLIAEEESTYNYSGTVYIEGTAETLRIKWQDLDYNWWWLPDQHNVSGSVPYSFGTEHHGRARRIRAEGWTSQGYHDMDECTAHIGGGNDLYLHLNVILPDPQLPED